MRIELYVAGNGRESDAIRARLAEFLGREQSEDWELAVIDVLAAPQLAEERAIVATPTIVCRVGAVERRLVGNAIDDEIAALAASRAHASDRATPHGELFTTLLRHSPVGLVVLALDGNVRLVNPAAEELLGHAADDLVNRKFGVPVLSGDRTEVDLPSADGGPRTAELSTIAIPWEGVEATLVMLRDVTDVKRARAQLRESEARLRAAFEDAGIGMALVALDGPHAGRIERANAVMCELTGITEASLCTTSIETLIHPEDRARIARAVASLVSGEVTALSADHRIVPRDGREVWVQATSSLIRGGSIGASSRIVQWQDITLRRRFETDLRRAADHGGLTGLLNRRRFHEEFVRELATARRYGSDGALLMLDLDNFKLVNDTLGHARGDELLGTVAGVLSRRLRASDVVARLGGDEFAAILPHTSAALAERIAEDLCRIINETSVTMSERGTHRITASIGVAPFGPGVGENGTDDVFAQADTALYRAKQAGRAGVAVFQPGDSGQSAAIRSLSWVAQIRSALADDRFVLHVQPIVAVEGRHTVQREVLLRMRDERGELVYPSSFLSVAERLGLIQEVDQWVVEHAISLLADPGAGAANRSLAINLSSKSIADPRTMELITRTLAETSVDPALLTFELTETAAVASIERARQFTRALRALGCRVALDDFGTGFASFLYLKHLEFDDVKIDGEFVSELATNPTNQLVIRAIVDVARGLDKRTTAEFVDGPATMNWLHVLGVDHAQGFGIALPYEPGGPDDPASPGDQSAEPSGGPALAGAPG